MKTIKKPISILLSLILICSMFTVIPVTTAWAAASYAITVADGITHGTITVPESAEMGTEVTIIAEPESTNVLQSISVKAEAEGTVSASLTALDGTVPDNTNETYSKLVDGNINTKWCLLMNGSPYIIVKAEESFSMTGYRLTTANDTDSQSGRNWKDWTIYGANFDSDSDAVQDSPAWQEVISVTDDDTLEAQNFKTYEFSLDTPAESYQYYMISITANHGNGMIQMSEFSLEYIKKGYIEDVEVSGSGNIRTFTMPSAPVRIDAVFGVNVPYLDGVIQYCSNPTVVTSETTELTPGWYAVTADTNIGKRIICHGNNINLILCDGATLRAPKGIEVPGESALNIYGQSGGTGALIIDSPDDHKPGIGSGDGFTSGIIRIYGGVITANGGAGAAGIGGGDNTVTDVSIFGGVITARGGVVDGEATDAGIGGGSGTDPEESFILMVWTRLSDSITTSGIRGDVLFPNEFYEIDHEGNITHVPYRTDRIDNTCSERRFVPYNTVKVTWKNWDGTVLKTDYLEKGDTPEYTGDTPTRAADEEYVYTFSGWTPDVASVTEDITYTATFTSEESYTVTWKNDDGTVLKTDYSAKGEMPAYDGDTPTKAADEDHVYTFSGWSPEISPVTQDITYTATFTAEEKYTVTWKNYDGTVLETDYADYGDTPEYNGNTPKKPGNSEYAYRFTGWSPEISPITKSITYTATFTADTPYTVTWENYNDTVLEIDYVAYGEDPEYNGDTPTKTPEPTMSFVFSHWSPELSPVTEDVTYKAQFGNAASRGYSLTYSVNGDEATITGITPKNIEGTLEIPATIDGYQVTSIGGNNAFADLCIDTLIIPEGVTKIGENAFMNCSKLETVKLPKSLEEIAALAFADCVSLVAIELPAGLTSIGKEAFSSCAAKYNYYFSVHFERPSKGQNLTIGSEAFDPWSSIYYDGDSSYTLYNQRKEEVKAGDLLSAYNNTTLLWKDSSNIFTVTWKNWDNTILETNTNVDKGTTPEYNGTEPTREDDNDYTYTYSGWTDSQGNFYEKGAVLPDVTNDETYTATYSKTELPYAFASHSLTLDGDIEINYYIETDEDLDGKAVVDFSWTVDDEKKTSSVTLTANDKTDDGYRATCPVTVAEMTCDVTATLKVGGKKRTTDTYSVKQYADTILSDEYRTEYLKNHTEEEYSKLSNLIETMLNYGARAQVWFECNTDHLADEDIDYDMADVKTNMITPTASDMSDGLDAYGLTYEESDVDHLSKASIRHCYTISDPEKFDAVKDQITFNGEAVDYQITDGGVCFVMTDIAAADLDTPYTLTIGTNEYSYAVLDYVYERIKDKYTPHLMTLLVFAAYWYNQAANDYFGV